MNRQYRLAIIASMAVLVVAVVAWQVYKIRYDKRKATPLPFVAGSAKKKAQVPHGWHRLPKQELDPRRKELLEQLSQLGYVSGHEEAPEDKAGVTTWNKESAFNGYNLIVSGQGPEALLTDMEGNVVHKWSSKYGQERTGQQSNFFRRAHLLQDGSLLVIFQGAGIFAKLAKDSRVLWTIPKAHHDIYVTKTDEIYTLRRKRRQATRPGVADNVIEDFVTVLTPDGEVVEEYSVIECFLNSDFAGQLVPGLESGGDITHTNTVQVIEDAMEHIHPALKQGNIVICMRTTSSIAVLNPRKRTIEWSMTSMFLDQHDATVLPSGNMLVFDNNGQVHFGTGGLRPGSRVLEFNMLTQEIAFRYPKKPDPSFYSGTSGAIQRLANGNTLIIESWAGRALEVTAQGDMVWEYYSPYRAGKNKDLIPHLCDVVRYSDSRVRWLRSGAPSSEEREEQKNEAATPG